jgi:predicted GNAT family N-acyltransferase
MATEIGLVFNKPNDRLWLPRLREWMKTCGPTLDKHGAKAPVNPLGSPDNALCWRAELPDERLLVAIGFSRGEIEAHRKFAVSCGEPIIIVDPGADDVPKPATASFFNKQTAVTCRDVTPQLRKSIIRSGLRKRVQIRPPSCDAELSGYFSLRYRVWDAMGFLRDEAKYMRTRWEIDFWDRMAVPLCAVTRDGRVIGCARLIGSHGEEQQPYVSNIQRLLNTTNEPALNDLFKFPHCAQHPFDLLLEFPGFRAHFRSLIRARKKVAEVGRVAVDAEYRGQFLSEVLVDTAVSFAEAKRVSYVFLACREELEPLYAKCGFQPVEGLKSDKFFNIRLPSIVMERRT